MAGICHVVDVDWLSGTDPAGGFLGGSDTYFCPKETRVDGGNKYLLDGNKYLRTGNDRRRFTNNRARNENECLRSGNDFGRRINSHFPNGESRVVEGLNRR